MRSGRREERGDSESRGVRREKRVGQSERRKSWRRDRVKRVR